MLSCCSGQATQNVICVRKRSHPDGESCTVPSQKSFWHPPQPITTPDNKEILLCKCFCQENAIENFVCIYDLYFFFMLLNVEFTRINKIPTHNASGVGVTKAPFVNFSVSKIFDLSKVLVAFVESLSYLTGITAAELRRYLPNINVIFNI